MRCPHCKAEGTAYYISALGETGKIYGCRNCKKRFRTKIERPEPPLHWEEAREVPHDTWMDYDKD
jgi:transcriptional regulator NrdR family protein